MAARAAVSPRHRYSKSVRRRSVSDLELVHAFCAERQGTVIRCAASRKGDLRQASATPGARAVLGFRAEVSGPTDWSDAALIENG
jgi:hypothetical protein